jgi:hypothetical protein
MRRDFLKNSFATWAASALPARMPAFAAEEGEPQGKLYARNGALYRPVQNRVEPPSPTLTRKATKVICG